MLTRHQLDRITAQSYVNPRNSVALPGVDVAREIELIDQGFGERVGDSRYRINGRVYAHKPDGETYPESGEMILSVTRPEFLLLRLLIKYEGRCVAFNRATERNPNSTEERIAVAVRLYHLWKDAQP
jgi:hypothetical protein